MRLKQYLTEQNKLKFTDEMMGTQSGQSDLKLRAFINNTLVGWIDYTDYQGEISVKFINVKQEYRKQGIGKELVLQLQKNYPKKEIDFGGLTPDGYRLIKSLKSKLYVDTEKINKIKKLEKEYKDLEKEEKMLVKKLEAGNFKNNEKIGKRLDNISDRTYEIEKELQDLK